MCVTALLLGIILCIKFDIFYASYLNSGYTQADYNIEKQTSH